MPWSRRGAQCRRADRRAGPGRIGDRQPVVAAAGQASRPDRRRDRGLAVSRRSVPPESRASPLR
jgi:hypothetical protein